MPVSASRRRRTLAVAIDCVCAALPLWVTAPLIIIFWSSGASGRLTALTILSTNAALSFILYFVVQTLQLARSRSTPGRHLLKLQVVDARGHEPGFARAFARELLGFAFAGACVLSGLYPLVLVPCVYTLIDTEGASAIDSLLRLRVHAREIVAEAGSEAPALDDELVIAQ